MDVWAPLVRRLHFLFHFPASYVAKANAPSGMASDRTRSSPRGHTWPLQGDSLLTFCRGRSADLRVIGWRRVLLSVRPGGWSRAARQADRRTDRQSGICAHFRLSQYPTLRRRWRHQRAVHVRPMPRLRSLEFPLKKNGEVSFPNRSGTTGKGGRRLLFFFLTVLPNIWGLWCESRSELYGASWKIRAVYFTPSTAVS